MNAYPDAEENEKSLTRVVEHVQCAATDAKGELGNEADGAAVRAFIEALVRIAHAVAARSTQNQQQEKTE